MIRVSDKESFNTARRLAREEGLLAGGSAGTALAAALKYAQRLEEPKYMVVLLPDTGRNYINKIFSDQWMQENGFWEGRKPKAVSLADVLSGKTGFPQIISVSPEDRLETAIGLMKEYGISQVPVISGSGVVGSLNEASLMKLLHDKADFKGMEISSVMGRPIPSLDEGTDVSEAYRLLLSGASGIVVKKQGLSSGLITRADLVNYWARRKGEGDYEI